MAPEVPPCLVRETDGASLVSVTLVRRTGADGAGCGGAAEPVGAAGPRARGRAGRRRAAERGGAGGGGRPLLAARPTLMPKSVARPSSPLS